MRESVFDKPHYIDFNSARDSWVRNLLEPILKSEALTTSLDVGCGSGYFSNLLCDLGINVTGVDGRGENVEMAKRKYPNVCFKTLNVEDPKFIGLGSFDIVLCFGLLYHLENPIRAIRNLELVTKSHLLIDSEVIPSDIPIATLQQEPLTDDQGLDYFALVPSNAFLEKTLYQVGFQNVYTVTKLPEHHLYRNGFLKKRVRTCLVASKTSLCLPQLVRALDVYQRRDWWRPLWYSKLRNLKRIFWKK